MTMGTPFLAMRSRPFPRSILFFFLVLFALGSSSVPRILIEEGWPNGVKSWYLVALFGAIAVAVVSTALILGWSMLLYRKTGTESRLSELVAGKSRGKPLSSDMNRISSPEIDEERILVVGAQGDEAAGVLGAAQLTSWLLASVLSGLRSRRGVFFFVGVVVIVFLIGVTLGGVDSFTEIDSLGGEILLVGGLAMLVASFLLVTAYLPFGADLLFWTLHADLTAGPLPKGTHTAFHAVTQSGGGLAHSVYDAPEAIDAVVAWIRGDQAQPVDE